MSDFNLFTVLDVDVVDILGDYDVPEDVPEWSWIERISSFKHVHNGEYGVWEFMVNLGIVETKIDTVPEVLLPTINKAIMNGYSYILFNQGT